jgi:hypothetical protein
MAELTAAMQEDEDVSPKLAQALNLPDTPAGSMAEPKTHEDIRAKARAYKPMDYDFNNAPRQTPEKPERLKDYTPADDPSWDSSWALGSGDQKLT